MLQQQQQQQPKESVVLKLKLAGNNNKRNSYPRGGANKTIINSNKTPAVWSDAGSERGYDDDNCEQLGSWSVATGARRRINRGSPNTVTPIIIRHSSTSGSVPLPLCGGIADNGGDDGDDYDEDDFFNDMMQLDSTPRTQY